MSVGTARPTMACPECGRAAALTAAGRLRAHSPDIHADGRTCDPRCPGSGRFPVEVTVWLRTDGPQRSDLNPRYTQRAEPQQYRVRPCSVCGDGVPVAVGAEVLPRHRPRVSRPRPGRWSEPWCAGSGGRIAVVRSGDEWLQVLARHADRVAVLAELIGPELLTVHAERVDYEA